MSFVPSLLQAIVRLDGEAVVLHVGDKPYVVTPKGQVDLATRGLNIDAVTGILTQLLPTELQNALDEFGAVQYELPSNADLAGEQFTIVAARGGEDIWLEIRRRRLPDEPHVAPDQALPPPPAPLPVAVAIAPPSDTAAEAAAPIEGAPPQTAAWASAAPAVAAAETSAPVEAPVLEEIAPSEDEARVEAVSPVAEGPVAVEPPPPQPEEPAPTARIDVEPPPRAPAPVLPLTRSPIRADVPPPMGDQTIASLDRLLRQAAARGAAVLYLSSGAQPAMRVDGDVQLLEGGPVLGPNDVESLLLALMPERSAEALRSGGASEWICDLPDLGRVRCTSFRDSRGPGGVFRLMPTRATSAEQLGLSREIQALALEPEGLVLVAGPRSSGKRTLISALVDVINRARRDHVITIEREINITHERGASFVSQREVRGGIDGMLAEARAALREDPDVLVLEEVDTPGLMNLALEAAASGQLVIGGFPAASAGGAVDRVIDLYPPESRRQVQLSLAQNLRGVVAQVLLRKVGGGRVAAREVLLNTPAVRSVLAEGRTSQLPVAIEGGRVHGMAPLNDALVRYVQAGVVDMREAYRRAADRSGFLALLKKQGLDTAALERYA